MLMTFYKEFATDYLKLHEMRPVTKRLLILNTTVANDSYRDRIHQTMRTS